MAYLLRFNGSPEHVSVDSHITLLSTQNYSVKYRVNIPVLRDQILSDAGDSVFNFNTYPFLRSNGGINVRAASATGATADFVAPSGSVPAGVDTEIEIRNDVALNKISILVDGDEKASRSASSFGIKRFGYWTTSSLHLRGDLLSCEVTLEGGVIHKYDPSVSAGQGGLVDSEGGNTGTPSGFSDFEAALIYYDDGSSELDPQPPAITGGSDVDGLSIVGVAASDVNAPSVTGGSDVDGLSIVGVAASDVKAPSVTGGSDVDGLTAGGSVASASGPPSITGGSDVDGLSIAGVAASDVNAPGVTGGSDVDGLTAGGSVASESGPPAVFGLFDVDGLSIAGVAASDVNAPGVTGGSEVDGLTAGGSVASESGPPAVFGLFDVDGLSIAGVAASDVNAPGVTGGSDVDGLTAGGSVASESGPPAVFGLFDVDGLSIAGVAASDVNAPGVTGGSEVDGLSVSGLFAGISLDFGISPVNRLDVRQRSNIIYIKHKEGF